MPNLANCPAFDGSLVGVCEVPAKVSFPTFCEDPDSWLTCSCTFSFSSLFASAFPKSGSIESYREEPGVGMSARQASIPLLHHEGVKGEGLFRKTTRGARPTNCQPLEVSTGECVTLRTRKEMVCLRGSCLPLWCRSQRGQVAFSDRGLFSSFSRTIPFNRSPTSSPC